MDLPILAYGGSGAAGRARMKLFNWEYDFDPAFPIHLFPFDVTGNRDSMHWHRYHEIGLCTGGTGKFVYLNKVYTVSPGDIFVSNNYESHVAISDAGEETQYLFLIFLPSIISAPSGQSVDAQYLRFLQYDPLRFENRISAQEPAAAPLGELIRKAYETYKAGGEFCQMELDILLRQILLTLSRARSASGGAVRNGPGQNPKIAEAREYINDHYNTRLTLRQVAGHLNLNESYFRHLFKNEMRISFKAYITLLRLANAQKLLIASEQSVNEVIQEVGYSNISQFYKIFELNFKMTPAEYRRRYREDRET